MKGKWLIAGLWVSSSVCRKYGLRSVTRQLPVILVHTFVYVRFSGPRMGWNLLTTLTSVRVTIQLHSIYSLWTKWKLCPSVQVFGPPKHSLWGQKFFGDCNTVSYCTIILLWYKNKCYYTYKIHNWTCSYIVGFQVSTAVVMTSIIFWDMILFM
jgi:hypothetical protein